MILVSVFVPWGCYFFLTFCYSYTSHYHTYKCVFVSFRPFPGPSEMLFNNDVQVFNLKMSDILASETSPAYNVVELSHKINQIFLPGDCGEKNWG